MLQSSNSISIRPKIIRPGFLYKITKNFLEKPWDDLSGKVSFGENANFFDKFAEKKPIGQVAT